MVTTATMDKALKPDVKCIFRPTLLPVPGHVLSAYVKDTFWYLRCFLFITELHGKMFLYGWGEHPGLKLKSKEITCIGELSNPFPIPPEMRNQLLNKCTTAPKKTPRPSDFDSSDLDSNAPVSYTDYRCTFIS